MKRRIEIIVLPLALLVCTCVMAAAPRGASARKEDKAATPATQPVVRLLSLDEALAELPKYQYGQPQDCLDAIKDAAVGSYGNAEARAKLTKRLIEVLGADSTSDARKFICRQLRIIASDEAVPALSKLLSDPDVSHLARAALEKIGTPAADAALRAALGQLSGDLLIGVIASAGDRRDAQAAAQLVRLLAGTDEAARAAASALGKIGGNEATAALLAARAQAKEPLQTVIADACLACAARAAADGQPDQAAGIYEQLYRPDQPAHVRVPALRGLVWCRPQKAVDLLLEALQGADPELQTAAGALVGQVPGAEATSAFAAILPKLAPTLQVVLLEALSSRGGKEALPAAIAMTKSDQAKVRVAAIRAIAALGDAANISLVVQAAASTKGDEQQAARAALDVLGGKDGNPVMLKLMQDAEPGQRVEAIRGLAARGAVEALPAMLKAAQDAPDPVRVQCYKSLADLAGENEAPALVNLLAQVKTADERTAAESAAAAACKKIAGGAQLDKCAEPALAALAKADVPLRCSLLRVLGRIEGEKALSALRSAAKDESAEISDTAVRAMADYSSLAVAPDLVALAKDSPKQNQRILALRGYVRLVGSQDLKPNDKLKRYGEAMALAGRVEEKRLVLGAMGDLKTAEALQTVMPYLDDETITEEAAQAAVNIAKALGPDGKGVKEAMQKVLAVAKNERVRTGANDVLGGKSPRPAPRRRQGP